MKRKFLLTKAKKQVAEIQAETYEEALAIFADELTKHPNERIVEVVESEAWKIIDWQEFNYNKRTL